MEKMVSPARALELVRLHLPKPTASMVLVSDALGLVLAESIAAPADIPAFDRAMMDGFAVCLKDAGKAVRVVGEAAAGHGTEAVVAEGQAVEIMTGAPCPKGTEAVVPVENTKREGDSVQLPAAIKAGHHVQTRGQICTQGAPILSAGTVITPLVTGVLSSFGRSQVHANPRPRVGIISTGDELVEGEVNPELGQIRDSNGPMLEAMARDAGAGFVVRTHARDNEESLHATLASVAELDIIVLTGGVSMGRYDLVPRMVEAMGAEPIFHKVAQQPGKPLFMAAGNGRMFFGLPGNPRSTHFCFARYVIPALKLWAGRVEPSERIRGRLKTAYRGKSDRTLFVPMRAESGADGNWELSPFDERGSADIYNIARANVYARFEPGEHTLAAGDAVEFFWAGDDHG